VFAEPQQNSLSAQNRGEAPLTLASHSRSFGSAFFKSKNGVQRTPTLSRTRGEVNVWLNGAVPIVPHTINRRRAAVSLGILETARRVIIAKA